MERIWNDLMAERAVFCGVAQAMVEGDIPQIEGRPASEILSATGDVSLSGAEAAEGTVRLQGEVCLQLICTGEGGVFAFTSKAAFRHTVPAEGAAAGMPVKAVPSLQSMEVKLEAGRISLHAVVDIALWVTDSAPLKALCGLEGVPDLEIKGQQAAFIKREPVFQDVLPLREEVDASDAQAVLQSDVSISLRDIQCDGRGTELLGSITVSALVEGTEGRLFQLSQSIPFSEMLEGAGGEDLRAELSLEDVQVRAAQEFGLLVIEGRLKVCLYGAKQVETTLPQDMFSPSIAFCCQRETVRLLADLGPVHHRHAFQETVNIPGGLPEIRRVIYTATRPVITACAVNEERLCVEGLLVTRVLYEGENGNLYAFTEDIPFETACPAPGAAEAMVAATATAAGTGSGRSLDVRFTLQICAFLAAQRTETLVADIAECERPAPPQGAVVYFAGAGETLYDVAKRFAIPRKSLGQEAEVLQEGQRLVFLR